MSRELENARQKHALPKKITVSVKNSTTSDFDLVKNHEKLLHIAAGEKKELVLPVDKLTISVDESGVLCQYRVTFSSDLKFETNKKDKKFSLNMMGSTEKSFDDEIHSIFTTELFEREHSTDNNESTSTVEIDQEGISFADDAHNAEYQIAVHLDGNDLEHSSLKVTASGVNA